MRPGIEDENPTKNEKHGCQSTISFSSRKNREKSENSCKYAKKIISKKRKLNSRTEKVPNT